MIDSTAVAAGGIAAFFGISVEFYINRKKTDGEVVTTFFGYAALGLMTVFFMPPNAQSVQAISIVALPHFIRLAIRFRLVVSIIDRLILKKRFGNRVKGIGNERTTT